MNLFDIFAAASPYSLQVIHQASVAGGDPELVSLRGLETLLNHPVAWSHLTKGGGHVQSPGSRAQSHI